MVAISRLHEQAIELRRRGMSYRDISEELGVARSTLSGWLKNIELSREQKTALHQKWADGLVRARVLASTVHREQKQKRTANIREEVSAYLDNLMMDSKMLEIFLSGLYLGDGFKSNGRFGFGNSDPELVVMFLQLIRQLYPLSESKVKVQIFARADQNIDEIEEYWSKSLAIPRDHFHKTQVDGRAIKSTRPGYHGVCAIVYPDAALQTRILAIGKEMIKYVGNLKHGFVAQLV